MFEPRTLAPASGVALRMDAGQVLTIEDVEGQQVSDLVVFRGDDPTERLSQGNTRKLNGTWLLSVGHVLYSTRCRGLLKITADTVGRHDLQSSACSPYDYPIRFGVDDHPSCLAILTEQLVPFEIPEHLIPDPLNVFMRTTMDPDSGAIDVLTPTSKAGDRIDLEALIDCIVALTVCPQDMNACNGGRITPLRVSVCDAA